MKNPLLLGAIVLVSAEALFSGVGTIVKFLSDELSESQLIFFRNLVALIILTPWMIKQGYSELKTERLGLHLFRAATGLVGMYCFFYVLANLPFSAAILAIKIAPFFIPIVASIWLKEKVSLKTSIAIVIGFIGVALVINPSNIDDFETHFVWVALFCALLVAITKCTLRKLSDTEPTVRIVYYFIVISTVISFFPLLFEWQTIDNTAWFLLVVIGVLAVIGQLLMTKAYKLASPVKIGLLGYSSVIFATFIGYFLWDEPITLLTIGGIALLFLAANMTIRQKWLF
jgi:drug/metabolite transporter (DMT)-like permease